MSKNFKELHLMRFLRSALTATIAATLISGCSHNSAAPGVSGALPPLDGSQSNRSSHLIDPSKGLVKPATSKNLYVADENGNDLTVYTSTGNFLYKITDAVSGPDAIAFDAAGDLYVANLGHGGYFNSVTVYLPGQLYPQYGFSLFQCPNALAIGPGGDFYVADSCSNSVSIWSLTVSSQDQVLSHNIQNPQALAFDSNGVLYVANGGTSSNPHGSVAVCTGSAPHRVCNKTIASHVDNPHALAVDRSNYVFVANDVASGNITKYKSYTLGNGYVNTWGQGDLDDPNALTFDSLGHLCASSPGNGQVDCFITFDRKFKTITNGIGSPTSMAVGPSGYLNVANFTTSKFKAGSVTQYCASAKSGCLNPAKTITSHIDGPASIGFGP
jgi:NHL repeat